MAARSLSIRYKYIPNRSLTIAFGSCGALAFTTAFVLLVTSVAAYGQRSDPQQAPSELNAPVTNNGSVNLSGALATTTTISANNNGLTATVYTDGKVGGEATTVKVAFWPTFTV